MSAYSHLSADFRGVTVQQLSNVSLLTGLLIAAAGAAGFPGTGAPIVRRLPNDGVTGVLALEGSQTSLLTDPDAGLLLLDVLAPSTLEPRKALDVFARRLVAREVHSEQRARG